MSQPTTEHPRGTVKQGTDDERATIQIDGDVFETLSMVSTDDGDSSRIDRWLETWSRGLP